MKKNPAISNHFTVFLILMPSLLMADDSYLAEDDFFGESPIVLSVSRLHKPLADSPTSVTVIDREMIRNSGAREIADLFRMVPGFLVGFAEGHSPSVTYHGLGQTYSRQMQVLIDGRSVYVPSFGGVTWSTLPIMIHDIERIEVTRSPNAVTYGANAFLATINIITRDSAEDLGGEISLIHDLDSDSTAQDFYARYGNRLGDIDWRVSIGREKDDGFDDYFKDPDDPDELEIKDSKLLEKINIRTDFQTGANQTWSIQVGVSDSTLERGDASSTDPYRDENTRNTYQNLRWDLVAPDVDTTFKLSHTRQDVEDTFLATESVFSAEANLDRLSDRTDLELFQNRRMNESLSWNYGLSLRRDKVKSFYLFYNNNTQETESKNLFSSLEWRSPAYSTIVDAGIFIEDSDNVDDRENSYRLSVIQPFGEHALRIVSSSAKRLPSLWEQIGLIQIDATVDPDAPPPFDVLAGQEIPFELRWQNEGNLKPESIVSNEIGLFSRFFNGQLTSDLKLFEYEIEDHMVDAVISSVLPPLGLDDEYDSVINGGTTRVKGLEWYFNFSPRNTFYRLYGGITLLDAESFELEGIEIDNDLEPSFPDHTSFVGGHWSITADHQVSGTLYVVDELSWTDTSDKREESYSKLDLRYQYTLDRKRDIRLELIGYNLAEDYIEYRDYNVQRKSYLLRLTGHF